MLLNNFLADSATWYPIRFDSPLNIARAVAFWLAVAFILAVVVAAIVFKAIALKDEKRKKFMRGALIAGIAFACAVAIVLLSLSFAEDGIKPILFIPILILVIAIAAGALTLCFNRSKPVVITVLCVVGAAFVAAFVCMSIHFDSGDAAADNWIEGNEEVDQVGLYISAVLAIAALVAAAFLAGRKDKKGFDSKTISYAGVCIAMSFALSYLRIVKMPQGGSITIASLLPLMVYSYMFGTKKGVIAGMIYGVLQAFQDNYILHPAQFLLDYPVAFASIGLAGMFAKTKALEKLPQVQFALGAIVAGLARFLMHFLSGVFAFGSYAGDTNVALYSFLYQAGYVLPDLVIAILAGIFLFCSPSFVRQARKYNRLQEA